MPIVAITLEAGLRMSIRRPKRRSWKKLSMAGSGEGSDA